MSTTHNGNSAMETLGVLGRAAWSEKAAAARAPVLAHVLQGVASGKTLGVIGSEVDKTEDTLNRLLKDERRRNARFAAQYKEAQHQASRPRPIESGDKIISTQELCDHFKIETSQFSALRRYGKWNITPIENRHRGIGGRLWSLNEARATAPKELLVAQEDPSAFIDDCPGYPGRYVLIVDHRRRKAGEPTRNMQIRWITNRCEYLPETDTGKTAKARGFSIDLPSEKRREFRRRWYINKEDRDRAVEQLKQIKRREVFQDDLITRARAAHLSGIAPPLVHRIIAHAKRYLGHKINFVRVMQHRGAAVRGRKMVSQEIWLDLYDKVLRLANDPADLNNEATSDGLYAQMAIRRLFGLPIRMERELLSFKKFWTRCSFMRDGRGLKPVDFRFVFSGGKHSRKLRWLPVYAPADVQEFRDGWVKAGHRVARPLAATASKTNGQDHHHIVIQKLDAIHEHTSATDKRTKMIRGDTKATRATVQRTQALIPNLFEQARATPALSAIRWSGWMQKKNIASILDISVKTFTRKSQGPNPIYEIESAGRKLHRLRLDTLPKSVERRFEQTTN